MSEAIPRAEHLKEYHKHMVKLNWLTRTIAFSIATNQKIPQKKIDTLNTYISNIENFLFDSFGAIKRDIALFDNELETMGAAYVVAASLYPFKNLGIRSQSLELVQEEFELALDFEKRRRDPGIVGIKTRKARKARKGKLGTKTRSRR